MDNPDCGCCSMLSRHCSAVCPLVFVLLGAPVFVEIRAQLELVFAEFE